MDITEALKVTNEDGSLENKNDNENAASRKRKRSGAKTGNSRANLADTSSDDSKTGNPNLTASANQAVDSDSSNTDSEDAVAEARLLVNNQRARRMECFEAALDNFINYHIQIEEADEERVILLRHTMTRIYGIIRSRSYYAGALALEKPSQ